MSKWMHPTFMTAHCDHTTYMDREAISLRYSIETVICDPVANSTNTVQQGCFSECWL